MMEAEIAPLFSNDAIVMGLLAVLLGAVFWTSSLDNKLAKGFYRIFPPLLLCYFLPSLLTLFNIVDPEQSRTYFIASRFLLPAALVLLTMSADLPATFRLGPKALIMFFTGTVGVVLGGPVALLIAGYLFPEAIGVTGPDAVWRGMATVAGTWIGGGANQAAMYEFFGVGGEVYSAWIAVDIIVANIWMAFLLLGVANAKRIDKALNADTRAVDALREKAETFEQTNARIPELKDLMIILGFGLGAMGLSHIVADFMGPWINDNMPGLAELGLGSGFFWLMLSATIIGVVLSFTKARQLSGVGSMKVGSVFIYVLVATIGMRMDITAIFRNTEFFVIGIIWMLFHVALLLLVAWLIKAPTFFIAVGSKANIGGAASAPVVAAAFHPSLAPVGVLLAVVGYIVGTWAAMMTGYIMMFMMGASVTP
ncbi:DUF819 domain-containing protein [Maricaulis sp.]|uniref:DUF819 family protein n=1 Tax=Maricaulis sp. TaxID=1486257 RepID=UPI003A95B1EB